MPVRAILSAFLLLVIISPARSQPKDQAARDEASRKKLQKYQSTWVVVSHDLDG